MSTSDSEPTNSPWKITDSVSVSMSAGCAGCAACAASSPAPVQSDGRASVSGTSSSSSKWNMV
eukprot:2777015-Amphidinium_carterae.2